MIVLSLCGLFGEVRMPDRERGGDVKFRSAKNTVRRRERLSSSTLEGTTRSFRSSSSLSFRSTTHAHSISPSHYRRLSLSPPFSTMASSLPSNGPSAATQANDILREDAKKGNTTVHTFDPDATPEQKAAAAGKGRDQLKSVVDTNKDAVASKGIFITSALHILPYP